MYHLHNTFTKDEYIQLMALKNFCYEHGLKTSDNKAELIKYIEEYSNINENNNNEVNEWLDAAVKQGSKEFGVKKIYGYNTNDIKNIEYVRKKLDEIYPDCQFLSLFNYKNTKINTLIDYTIFYNSKNEVVQISFIFSRLVLEGMEVNDTGDEIIYPVFIDLYVDKGFIVSRSKAKSTIYNYDDNSKIIKKENKIDTMSESIKLMDSIIDKLGFLQEKNEKKAKHSFGVMMYKLYQNYSFTPDEIVTEINRMDTKIKKFSKEIFDELGLNYMNLPKAIEDMKIFVEKYISINGNYEHIFKEDRDAYLIKISSDDIQDMTRIDTASSISKPLQCTDVFFDSKKAIIKNKECKKLHLCYNRSKKYLGPFSVQFGYKNNYGIVKTSYYPEESDIENVLQTIFKNF